MSRRTGKPAKHFEQPSTSGRGRPISPPVPDQRSLALVARRRFTGKMRLVCRRLVKPARRRACQTQREFEADLRRQGVPGLYGDVVGAERSWEAARVRFG